MLSDLTQAELKAILHYEPKTGVFTRLCRVGNQPRGARAGSLQADGYRYIGINGKRHAEHRLAWLYVYGVHPTNVVDHKDRDPANNRIANLRDVTQRENLQNMGNKTPGVYFMQARNRWRAQVQIGMTKKNLGNFLTKEAAVAARTAYTATHFA